MKKKLLWIFLVFAMCFFSRDCVFAQQDEGERILDGHIEYHVKDGEATVTNSINCYGLDIVIPREINGYKVTAIGNNAFNGCNAKSIELPDTIKTIEFRAFYDCETKDIKLSEGIETIGRESFSGCLAKEIYIPKSVKLIKYHAFSFSDLENVMFAGDVDGLYIESMAFCGCKNLKRLEIPEGTTYIEDDIIYSSNVEYLSIPSTVKTIQANCFRFSYSLKTVKLADGIERLEKDAFSYCENLQYINLPDSITYIGGGCFSDTNIENIILPKNLELLRSYMFFRCTNLKNVQLPEGIVKIESEAFRDCTSLTKIILPESINQMGIDIFEGCENLERVDFLSTSCIPYINTFKGCDKVTLYVREALRNKVGNLNVNIKYFTEMKNCVVGNIRDREYTGKNINIKPKIRYNGELLVEGKDYTISYKNNKDIGRATVVYKGMGDYAGTKEVTFLIIPTKAKNMSITNIKATSVVINWKEDPLVDTYIITARDVNGKAISEFVENEPGLNSVTLTGLDSAMKYNVTITSITKRLSTLFNNVSNSISFYTNPSKVYNLRALSDKKKNLYMTWNAVKRVDGYQVKIATSRYGTYSTVCTAKGTILSRYGYTSGKTYYLKVRAYKVIDGKKVYGLYSDVKSVKIK